MNHRLLFFGLGLLLLLSSCGPSPGKRIRENADAFMKALLEKDYESAARLSSRSCTLFPLNGYNTLARPMPGKPWAIEKVVIDKGSAELDVIVGKRPKPLKLYLKNEYNDWFVDCERSQLTGDNDIILNLIPHLYDFSHLYRRPSTYMIADSFFIALSTNDTATALQLVSEANKESFLRFMRKGNLFSGKKVFVSGGRTAENFSEIGFSVGDNKMTFLLPLEKTDTVWTIPFDPGMLNGEYRSKLPDVSHTEAQPTGLYICPNACVAGKNPGKCPFCGATLVHDVAKK